MLHICFNFAWFLFLTFPVSLFNLRFCRLTLLEVWAMFDLHFVTSCYVLFTFSIFLGHCLECIRQIWCDRGFSVLWWHLAEAFTLHYSTKVKPNASKILKLKFHYHWKNFFFKIEEYTLISIKYGSWEDGYGGGISYILRNYKMARDSVCTIYEKFLKKINNNFRAYKELTKVTILHKIEQEFNFS